MERKRFHKNSNEKFSSNKDDSMSQRPSYFVPAEIQQYLSTIAEHFEHETDETVKDSLAENCREECLKLDVNAMFCSDCGDIITTICNHHPTLSVFFLEKLTKRKRKEICTVLLHTRGSRCVESIIFNVAKLIDDNPFAIQLITEITETAIAEFERLSGDFSGSHVLRCLGRVLCGVGKNQEKNSNVSTPPEFRSLLTSLMGLVLNWTYISNFINRESVSLLVQEYLEIDAKYAKTNSFSQWMEACCTSDKDNILYLMENKHASRIWEKVILLCSEDDLERLFKSFMQENLVHLSTNSFANFIVQRLLERCKTEEMLTDIFEELILRLEDLWDNKKFGVIVAMARAAVLTRCRQKEFLKNLRQVVGCKKKNERLYLIPVLLQLIKYDNIPIDDKGKPLINQQNIQLHGSLLIQNLLNFKKNDSIVESLLSLHENELLEIACNSIGSRVFDAYYTSTVITNEQKQELLRKLQGNLVKLVCDRLGSRVFECIWTNVNFDDKFSMAATLVKKESAIKTNQFGRILYEKYQLMLLKKNKNHWKNQIENVNRNKKRKIVN